MVLISDLYYKNHIVINECALRKDALTQFEITYNHLFLPESHHHKHFFSVLKRVGLFQLCAGFKLEVVLELFAAYEHSSA